MGSRWWALAFVVFVCWQAVDFVDGAPGAKGKASIDAKTDAAETRAVGDALNAM